MNGGLVQQIVGDRIEVLDTVYFDRVWRIVEKPSEIREGDTIWWQGFRGYLMRPGAFTDKHVGFCHPATSPGTRK